MGDSVEAGEGLPGSRHTGHDAQDLALGAACVTRRVENPVEGRAEIVLPRPGVADFTDVVVVVNTGRRFNQSRYGKVARCLPLDWIEWRPGSAECFQGLHQAASQLSRCHDATLPVLMASPPHNPQSKGNDFPVSAFFVEVLQVKGVPL